MKRIYSLFPLLTLFVMVNAQYDPKENFYDAEFFFAEEDYSEALYSFTKVYNDGYADNANINYRMGVCMLQIEGRKREAIPYLEKATGNITEKYREGNFKEEQAPPDAWLNLGNAYRIDHQFEKAIESYNTYLDFFQEETETTIYVRLQIRACEQWKAIDEEKLSYETGTLGQINRIRAPIYNPVVSGDLSTLSFMGRQKFYNGVFVSRNEEGKWTKPYNITPSIQSDGNQNVVALSHDGNTMLLAWYDVFNSDIWISRYADGRWNRSEPLDKPINSKYYESHAAFTPDENTIYFTSNRKESLGGMDIFKCTKDGNGNWSELVLLGETINTPLNEENPFVSPDGKRLYFSSQGHDGGLGGFDIYYADIHADGTLGKPVHLDYPLNTADDDFAFMEEEDYLTIYARGEEGQVDLFRFEIIPESAQPVALAFQPDEGAPGEMADAVTDAVEDVAETIGEIEEEIEEVAEEIEEIAEEAPETYMIRPVFFDFDSFSLTPAALKKLEDLADIMRRYPNIHLEVIGHTDAVGTRDYNFVLAQKRAKAVADHLISLGVEKDRLSTESKGETEHVALNRTPDDRDAPGGRALNRRVHFRASVPDGIIHIATKKIEVPEELQIK